jgi:hypothetical protein
VIASRWFDLAFVGLLALAAFGDDAREAAYIGGSLLGPWVITLPGLWVLGRVTDGIQRSRR